VTHQEDRIATAAQGVRLIRKWEATETAGERKGFLLALTAHDLDAISRLASKEGHPEQQKGLALLRAIYAV
jgi:hypothetical protein